MDDVAQFEHTIQELRRVQAARGPCEIDTVLFADSSPELRACMDELQARVRPATKEDEDRESQWRVQITAWRDKLEITPNLNVLEKVGATFAGVRMTHRARNLLEMVANEKAVLLLRQQQAKKSKKVKLTKQLIQTAISKVVVDISQNPCRHIYTNAKGQAHTMCTSSELVHLGKRRALHPKEMMFLQGHNPQETRFPSRMALEDIKKLAGEGMSLPCLGLCIWGQFLLKGFPDAPE